jgi:hypothetical protein
MSPTPHEGPGLFDLPLAPAARSGEPDAAVTEVAEVEPVRRARRVAATRPESLPLFTEQEWSPEPAPAPEEVAPARARSEPAAPATGRVPAERPRPVPVPPAAAEPPTAGLAARLRANAGDLAILAAVASAAAGGATLLGAPIGREQVPALAGFLLAWSFVYFVVSLAFWGQTPGMAWAGVVARSGPTEPLSFSQTARRWVGTGLTWLLAGLPGLLALSGRSLADRLSASQTFEQPAD